MKAETTNQVIEVTITLDLLEAQDLLAVVEGLTVRTRLQRDVLSAARNCARKQLPGNNCVNQTLMELWSVLDDVLREDK